MGGRREVSIIFYRPVTRSDLKQERSFFRGSVSSFLQLVVYNHLIITTQVSLPWLFLFERQNVFYLSFFQTFVNI